MVVESPIGPSTSGPECEQMDVLLCVSAGKPRLSDVDARGALLPEVRLDQLKQIVPDPATDDASICKFQLERTADKASTDQTAAVDPVPLLLLHLAH